MVSYVVSRVIMWVYWRGNFDIIFFQNKWQFCFVRFLQARFRNPVSRLFIVQGYEDEECPRIRKCFLSFPPRFGWNIVRSIKSFCLICFLAWDLSKYFLFTFWKATENTRFKFRRMSFRQSYFASQLKIEWRSVIVQVLMVDMIQAKHAGKYTCVFNLAC